MSSSFVSFGQLPKDMQPVNLTSDNTSQHSYCQGEKQKAELMKMGFEEQLIVASNPGIPECTLSAHSFLDRGAGKKVESVL